MRRLWARTTSSQAAASPARQRRMSASACCCSSSRTSTLFMDGGKRRSSAWARLDPENLIPANGMETAAMPSAGTHSRGPQFNASHLENLGFYQGVAGDQGWQHADHAESRLT